MNLHYGRLLIAATLFCGMLPALLFGEDSPDTTRRMPLLCGEDSADATFWMPAWQQPVKEARQQTISPERTLPVASGAVIQVQAIEPLPEPEKIPDVDPEPICAPRNDGSLEQPSPCETYEDADQDRLPELDSLESDKSAEPAAESPRQTPAIKPIQDIDLACAFTPLDKLPDDFRPLDPSNRTHRDPYLGSATTMDYRWTARNLSHRTLYFDDMPLERYGLSHGDCKQSICSALHFLGDFAAFPFRWAKEEPCALHYTLGLTRSGTCPPRVKERCCPVH